jgi:hypothetical protein
VGDLPRIVSAHWTEISVVSALIADASESLDLAAWLVPDPATRREVLTARLRFELSHLFMFGTTQVLDDRSAVAVWVRRHRPIPPSAHLSRPIRDCGAEAAARFEMLDKALEAAHPTRPHHHLAFLAVNTESRHTGRAAALLTKYHAHLDHAGMPAYAQAPDPATQAFLARHGYNPTELLHLPDGPTLYPMWRPPSGRSTED